MVWDEDECQNLNVIKLIPVITARVEMTLPCFTVIQERNGGVDERVCGSPAQDEERGTRRRRRRGRSGCARQSPTDLILRVSGAELYTDEQVQGSFLQSFCGYVRSSFRRKYT